MTSFKKNANKTLRNKALNMTSVKNK